MIAPSIVIGLILLYTCPRVIETLVTCLMDSEKKSDVAVFGGFLILCGAIYLSYLSILTREILKHVR